MLHALVILNPRPHQPAHQTLWYAWPDAKVEVGAVGSPEQARIGCLLNFCDLRTCKRQLKGEKARQPFPKGAMPRFARHGVVWCPSWSCLELCGGRFGTHFAEVGGYWRADWLMWGAPFWAIVSTVKHTQQDELCPPSMRVEDSSSASRGGYRTGVWDCVISWYFSCYRSSPCKDFKLI